MSGGRAVMSGGKAAVLVIAKAPRAFVDDARTRGCERLFCLGDLSGFGADVICCTRSGLPWQRRINGTLVVNVAVLGKPANDGQQHIWYAILDLDSANDGGDGEARAELVPLDYDWRAQAVSMRAAGLPEAFTETIETGWWKTCLEVLPPRILPILQAQLLLRLPTRLLTGMAVRLWTNVR